MNIWATLGGVALGITGAVTGQPELIGAGASLIGTGVAADGAKKAADQQAAAAAKAQADANARYDATRGEQRTVFNNAMQGFAPYQALGVGATGNLGQLVGLSSNPALAQAPVVSAPTSAPAATPTATEPVPGVVPPQTRAEQMNASGYQMQGGKRDGMDASNLGALGGGLVWVQAPTGERMRMPAVRAQQAVLKGAQIVG